MDPQEMCLPVRPRHDRFAVRGSLGYIVPVSVSLNLASNVACDTRNAVFARLPGLNIDNARNRMFFNFTDSIR